MLLKFAIFAFCCSYFTFVRGYKKTGIVNSGETKLIATQLLFMNESTNVFFDIEIPKGSQPPLMMMSVMLLKTLVSDIQHSDIHFFSSFYEKQPVIDLNATNNDIVLSASTSSFKIDFTTKTLKAVPSSLIVRLYPYMNSSAVRDNETEPIVTIKSSNDSGSILYSVDLHVSVNSTVMEGMYKFYLHSSGTVRTSYNNLVSPALNFYRDIFYIQKCFYKLVGLTGTCGAGVIYVVWLHCDWHDFLQHQLTMVAWCTCTLGHIFLIFRIAVPTFSYVNVCFIYLLSSGVVALCCFSTTVWSYTMLTWEKGKMLRCIAKTALSGLVYLMVVFILLQSWYSMDVVAHTRSMIFINLLTHSVEFLLCAELIMINEDYRESAESQMEEDRNELPQLYFKFFCSFVMYAYVRSFNLILAAFAWLEVPVRLFWIQIAIEELLQLLFVGLLLKMIRTLVDCLTELYPPRTYIVHSPNEVGFSWIRVYFMFFKRRYIFKISDIKETSILERTKLTFRLLLRNQSIVATVTACCAAFFLG